MAPREPTKEMLDAVEGWDSNTIVHRETARALWAAMWDAAQMQAVSDPAEARAKRYEDALMLIAERRDGLENVWRYAEEALEGK